MRSWIIDEPARSVFMRLCRSSEHTDIDTATVLHRELKARLPDLLAQAVCAWGDEASAVAWFTDANPMFRLRSPLRLLAEGEVEPIVDELARIECGDLTA